MKDKYTYFYEYHIQISFLKYSLNEVLSRLHGVVYQCKCTTYKSCNDIVIKDCVTKMYTFKSVTHLWESILCPMQLASLFHNRSCLMGECKYCGVEHLETCPNDISMQGMTIGVKVFAYEKEINKSQQFKDCLHRYLDYVIVSIVDFSQNYMFKEQHEIQSMHWHSRHGKRDHVRVGIVIMRTLTWEFLKPNDTILNKVGNFVLHTLMS
ncbi:hypothetical protein KP509_33G004800 [Ceratopteris richardii]|uniref:Uncharacterized protein n=1 Tax=Ceratopteris richardii TaxID=49495 RepID=A0A8T2QME5_CERRI|nr:hypothetical protein KP509_33G004800 [Ceratopteris richardii]